MKPLLTPIALGLSFVCFSVFAAHDNPYHHEVSVAVSDNSSDSNIDTHWKGKYTYYTNSIDPNKGPYRLNAFLAHSSLISVNYNHRKNYDNYGIKGKLFFEDHWFVAGNYHYSDDNGKDKHRYSVELGNYISDATKVYVSAERFDVNVTSNDYDFNQYSLGSKGYIETDADMGLLLKAEYRYTDFKYEKNRNSHGFALEADYFFNKSLSIGGHYSDGRHEQKVYGARANYFLRISDNVSLDLSLDKRYEPNQDGVNWGAKLVGRF